MKNRQRPFPITAETPDGVTKTLFLADWSRVLNVPYNTLHERMKQGLSDDEILNTRDRRKAKAITVTVDGRELTLSEWSKIAGVPRQTIVTRLRRGKTGRAAIYGA
ncbi:hypothetical protein [Planctomycetes bacterium TBK1r]|uniref:Uncharacterized protein n=1 Tax=Stieleria magnilauensis TaxID=2527963 RepID=A0ABX5XRD1_9BACT|nr:hypothetical protein TBK1r_35130 [Planctomycetes bacterium TBK1r]